MVRHLDLRIDVSNAVGLGEPAQVAASVVLPDPELLTQQPIVCIAKPSSSYSRRYFTTDLPGPGHGAQAEWHAARGWIFVAIDMLGCGESSSHDSEKLDFATLTAAAKAAEDDLLLRLANGVLLDGYPPVNRPVVIGIGHSLGGALLIYQQARHRTYDGIGVLGFSAVHSHPATPPGGPPVVVAWYPRDATLEECTEPLNLRALAATAESESYEAAWKSLGWGFHYDDVPQDVVEQDLRHYEAVGLDTETGEYRHAPWNSYTTPRRAARATLTPGIVAAEAAAVDVPVLAAMAVRDLVADPPGEARAYRSSRSVDLFVCPRMGHVHNFASTRTLFWERIHHFGQWCAVLKSAEQ